MRKILISLLTILIWNTSFTWEFETYDTPLPLFPKWAFGFIALYQNGTSTQLTTLNLAKEFRTNDFPVSAICPAGENADKRVFWDYYVIPGYKPLHAFPDLAKLIKDLQNIYGCKFLTGGRAMFYKDHPLRSEAVSLGFGKSSEDVIYLPFTPDKSGASRMNKCEQWYCDRHKFLFEMGIADFLIDDSAYCVLAEMADYAAKLTGKRIVTERAWGGMGRTVTKPISLVGIWQGDPGPTFPEWRYRILGRVVHGLGGNYWFSPESNHTIGLDKLKHPFPELQRRVAWEVAFCPCIAGWDSTDARPWTFGQEAFIDIRKAVKFHMRLVPYLYSYAWIASQTKWPIVRALELEFPSDPKCKLKYTKEMVDDQITSWFGNGTGLVKPYENDIRNFEYMSGKEILVAPMCWEKQDEREIYLPAGATWIDLWDSTKSWEGGQTIKYSCPLSAMKIPAFVKKGSIIPLGPEMYYPDELPGPNPLTLKIYPSTTKASFTLYEDDGITWEYKEGKYATTKIECYQTGESVVVEIGPTTGSYNGQLTERKYILEVNTYNVEPTSIVKKILGSQDAFIKYSSYDELEKSVAGWYYDNQKKIVYVMYSISLTTPPYNIYPIQVHISPAITGIKEWNKREIDNILQNYPNPFNPECYIPYELKDNGNVKVRIYNVLGQKVRELEIGQKQASKYITKDKAAYWDGKDNKGKEVVSGVYYYELVVDGKVIGMKKSLVLK